MLKKRNNEEIGILTPVSSSLNNGKELTFSTPKIRSYKDEAILVLNILEANNIDIYNPRNKPGMYLNRKNKNNISSKLKEKFQENNDDENNSSELTNLFQHLKTIKK